MIAASLDDPDRFTEIFERHFDAIYGFTARRLGREIADDVGATVFVEAFSARTRFELDRADARPWLYGIATNLIHRHRRSRDAPAARVRPRRSRRRPGRADGHRAAARRGGDGAAARVRAARSRRRAIATRSCCSPGPGLSYDDIAIATDVPVGTVRSRIHRARHRLRAVLGDHRSGAECGMSDLELDLLRDWPPDDRAAVRRGAGPRARASSRAQYVASPVAPTCRARPGRQFGKRLGDRRRSPRSC